MFKKLLALCSYVKTEYKSILGKIFNDIKNDIESIKYNKKKIKKSLNCNNMTSFEILKELFGYAECYSNDVLSWKSDKEIREELNEKINYWKKNTKIFKKSIVKAFLKLVGLIMFYILLSPVIYGLGKMYDKKFNKEYIKFEQESLYGVYKYYDVRLRILGIE